MRILNWSLLLSVAVALNAGAADPSEGVVQVFERVFGAAVRFDPAMHAKVLADTPGKRHYVDADNDGQPEEVWFVDTALRHPEDKRPVLVRVIDEDGDLEMGHEPDLDSDLYIADWQGTGVVNAVCDYNDEDGDNDVDEMAFYFPNYRSKERPEIMVWWGYDVGDDNLLWYDIAYTYNQGLCQYRTHFGGDEFFCAYTLGLDDEAWVCFFENPFLFYDHDGDGVTEEVIRFSGRNEEVGSLRYSYDADDDGDWDHPRDFDVSITAHAREGHTFDLRLADRRSLRGIPTGPFLDYYLAPAYSRAQHWADMMLTWDENDLNIDGDNLVESRFRDTLERWEGLITKGNDWFKQVGGPSVGQFNKRFELAEAPTGPMQVYYAPTDRRIHLFGANRSWMAVDIDYDQQPEMRYEFLDKDEDGYIDLWTLDVDGDGEIDDSWQGRREACFDLRYTWGEMKNMMGPVLAEAPQALCELAGRLQEALKQQGDTAPDTIWQLLESGYDTPQLTPDLRERLMRSDESMRYSLDLIKDRLIIRLKKAYMDEAFWKQWATLRAQGDWPAMSAALAEAFSLTSPPASYTALKAKALAPFDTPRTGWAEDWIPPNIGWESDRCAYRAYWGQFDFFGKHEPGLVLDRFGEGVNYHVESDWGMDALHVGETGGLGGLILYINGVAWPVYSPKGEGPITWSKRLVSKDNQTVCIELVAENVGEKAHPYTVRFHCYAYAGRRDARIEVTLSGGRPEDELRWGLALVRLPQEAFALDASQGLMASWGVQEAAIGYIGLGVLFPKELYWGAEDTDQEHRVVLTMPEERRITWGIEGDWLRGRRFNRCPTLENWLRDLARLRLYLKP